MFVCDICGKNSQPKEPVVLKTVETRKKHYVQILKRKNDNDKLESKKIESDGVEIVKEIKMCPRCVETQ